MNWIVYALFGLGISAWLLYLHQRLENLENRILHISIMNDLRDPDLQGDKC